MAQMEIKVWIDFKFEFPGIEQNKNTFASPTFVIPMNTLN